MLKTVNAILVYIVYKKDGICNQNCPIECATCEEITGKCITCSDPNRNISNECKCIPGYFQNGT